MRSYSATIMQNTADGTLGAAQEVSAIITELGAASYEIDKDLTKIAPSDQSLKLADHDGSVWSFIQYQLTTAGALYPPILSILVDGIRQYTGFIKPSQISRDEKTGEITIQSQDWSSALTSKYLGAAKAEDDENWDKNPWLRRRPKGTFDRPESGPHNVQAAPNYPLGFPGSRSSIWCFESSSWAQVGDTLTVVRGGDGATFTGVKVLSVTRGTVGVSLAEILVDKEIWPVMEGSTPLALFSGLATRMASAQADVNYYTVTETVADDAKGVYTIKLDTVDGLAQHDKLEKIMSQTSASFTVLQLNPWEPSITVAEEVKGLTAGDRLWWDKESAHQLVLEDARKLITMAAAPYGVNFDRYQTATLPVPVLAWAPMRPFEGADLTPVIDLEAGQTSVRVFGLFNLKWDGTVEAGWEPVTVTGKRAGWTDQLTMAPYTLMPYDETRAPHGPGRYKVWNLDYRNPFAEDFDPIEQRTPETIVFYDYVSTPYRRVEIAGQSGHSYTWNEVGFDDPVAFTAPSGVLDACPYPGIPGTIVYLTSTGIDIQGSVSAGLAVEINRGSYLHTTVAGVFVVSAKGYGRIQLINGAVEYSWVSLITTDGAMMPNTFSGYDSESVFVLARFDARDTTNPDLTVTETRFLQLTADPTTASTAILRNEKLLDGAPTSAGLIRHPVHASTLIGHCGGQLFQVSPNLTQAYAVERFTPSGMKAQELIEHITQLLCCLAVPDATGTLHIISRNEFTGATSINVDVVESRVTRAWEHHYSVVRVTGAQDDLLFDAQGAISGGQVLEVSSHPLLWTQSATEAMARLFALWFGTPKKLVEQTWFHSNPNTAPEWEALPPLAKININGSGEAYLVLQLSNDRVAGTAQVLLLLVEEGL